jgi:hypothetical protein
MIESVLYATIEYFEEASPDVQTSISMETRHFATNTICAVLNITIWSVQIVQIFF